MLYLGIDPGVTGAIAVLDDTDGSLFICELQPSVNESIGVALTNAERESDICLVAVERPVPMSGNAGTIAKQFQLFGEILGWLAGAELPHEIVTPQKWQKAVLPTLPKGRDKVKRATVEWALSRFPKTNFKRTEKCSKPWQDACDAAALAVYAKMRSE